MIGCIVCSFQEAYRAQLREVTITSIDEQGKTVGDAFAAGFGLARRQIWIGTDLDLAVEHACDRHQSIVLRGGMP